MTCPSCGYSGELADGDVCGDCGLYLGATDEDPPTPVVAQSKLAGNLFGKQETRILDDDYPARAAAFRPVLVAGSFVLAGVLWDGVSLAVQGVALLKVVGYLFLVVGAVLIAKMPERRTLGAGAVIAGSVGFILHGYQTESWLLLGINVGCAIGGFVFLRQASASPRDA